MSFVIADIGSNWTDIESAKSIIKNAAQAGVQAVKFQMFKTSDLYHKSAGVDFSKHELPVDWLPELKKCAELYHLEFMCSVFSLEAAEAVNPYVVRHKIASSEVTNKALLDQVLGYGKPTLVSIGNIRSQDYKVYNDVFDYLASIKNVIPLHCVQDYPTKEFGINLACLYNLREKFNIYGISDHTTNFKIIPMMATALDCLYFEKHFKGDSTAITPDSPHSLNTKQMKFYIDNIDIAEKIVWRSRTDKFIEKKVMAIQAIKQGEKFVLGKNIGLLRNPTGVSAWDVGKYADKKALRDYAEGEPIDHLARLV